MSGYEHEAFYPVTLKAGRSDDIAQYVAHLDRFVLPGSLYEFLESDFDWIGQPLPYETWSRYETI